MTRARVQVDGQTEVIAHIGYPTHTFRAPLIYNPWFAQIGVNVLVVPMSCRAEHFPAFLRSVFTLTNVRGALITMPHKVSALALLDELSVTARIAGACNAVRRLPDGRLLGDQFDGAGFVRGVQRKGLRLAGARALVVGCGGVGRAIAASLAAAGVAALRLVDLQTVAARQLAHGLAAHYPALAVEAGAAAAADPAGFDLVVNATPLGSQPGDPLPVDPERLAACTFVGDVALGTDMTPLLSAAHARGCRVQVGADMLYEMIPAYLEFFDLPVATAEQLRALAEPRRG